MTEGSIHRALQTLAYEAQHGAVTPEGQGGKGLCAIDARSFLEDTKCFANTDAEGREASSWARASSFLTQGRRKISSQIAIKKGRSP